MRRTVSVLWLLSVGLLSAVLLLWAHPVGRDSSVLNQNWNGLSQASEMLGATALGSYDDVADLPLPVTLVVIPRLSPDEVALTAMEACLVSGGTLVVLDDFGFGNEILFYLGVGVRFHGGTLMDPLYCHRDASMPRVEWSRAETELEWTSMVLNRATWLRVDEGVEVWATSSYFSYGDVDGDSRRDDDEPSGPLPVAAVVSRSGGRVVIVSDSSLLLNSMVGLGGNVEAIASFVRGDVLVDHLHLPEGEMDRSQIALDALRGVLKGETALIVLVFMACCFAAGHAWYNRGRRHNERAT